jgi:hypothetical protein
MGRNVEGNGTQRNRTRAVYIGHDSRQPLAYNVMRYSIERHASRPISVNGLHLHQLPISRVGATEFTYSRFLVPWLMDFQGYGLFCDEDMVVEGDVWELFSYCTKRLDPDWDVALVKHEQQYEWPSVMVFNNERLKHLTPEYIDDKNNRLFDFAWAQNVAEIPAEWNHLCGMQDPKPAKLYHFSQGIPYWKETRGLVEDPHWFDAFEAMVKSEEWIAFHKDTIHFKPVMRRYLKNYGLSLGKDEQH